MENGGNFGVKVLKIAMKVLMICNWQGVVHLGGFQWNQCRSIFLPETA